MLKNTRFKKTLIAVALTVLSQSAVAATISGQVVDTNGRPIKGAKVSVEGSTTFATTDNEGRYQLLNVDPRDVHLHVYSEKHVHGDKDFGQIGDSLTANFELPISGIENVVITANSMQTSILESIAPVSVLSAEQLRRAQAPTLGETLKSMPGVHSNYFGPVASSPIIRGTDGPRVKIIQNGLDISDASRVGPDHNVGTDVSSATQVEVLRGPATLQYGSGAIGGVVNTVDQRIPTFVPEGIEGEAEMRYETAGNERFAKVDLTGGKGNIAFHFDGFTRETDDYDIPGFAEIEPEEGETKGTLEGTAIDGDNLTAGVSYVGDRGYFGMSVQAMNNLYGVPGHGHGHGDEDAHNEEHAEEDIDTSEESVNLKVDLTRIQLAGEWLSPSDLIDKISYRGAISDYEHAEIEGEEIGTVFTNETNEHRLALTHSHIADWHGVFGVHYLESDYKAIGEEAFTPPSITESFAAYLIEEKEIGNVTFELGARIEKTELSADAVEIDLLVAEEHEEEHDVDEHTEEHESVLFDQTQLDFTSLSLSAGLNWRYQPDHSLSVSLSRSERAPSHQELFSAGEHIATQTYELGMLYTLDEHNEVILNPVSPQEEVSNNIDVTLRKFSDEWGYSVSAFYNSVDDYIYQANSGLLASEHGHDEHDGDEHVLDEETDHVEEDGHEEHAEGTDIFLFQQEDATLYGLEFDGYYQFNSNWRLNVFGDYIRAKLDSCNLPRIPPMKLGATLNFEFDRGYGDIGVTWYGDQDTIAVYETETNGYALLSASINYVYSHHGVDWVFFAQGRNLTDEEARVHTSVLKDQAPLPGRGLTLGVSARF